MEYLTPIWACRDGTEFHEIDDFNVCIKCGIIAGPCLLNPRPSSISNGEAIKILDEYDNWVVNKSGDTLKKRKGFSLLK